MKNTYHKFILILLVVVLFGGVYLYFVSDLKTEAANSPLSSSSDLASSSDNNPNQVLTDEKLARDIAFLATLGSLKTIKIDTSLFESQAFKSLNYNQVIIEHITPGRENPFAPTTNTTTLPRTGGLN